MGTITARVQCIVKGNRYSPHEAIQFIGGVNPDGATVPASVTVSRSVRA